MKETLLIFAMGRKPWLGGIYYRRNIVYSLLQNDRIRSKYSIVVLTTPQYEDVFKVFGDEIKLAVKNIKVTSFSAMLQLIRCRIIYHAKYVFPIKYYPFFKLFGIRPISWIADFQHKYYGDFFSTEEIESRERDFTTIAASDNPLILSSNDCQKDFRQFYNADRKNVYVIPFVSYIEEEIRTIKDELQVLQAFELLPQRYFCISNQFWQHKNHLVVFKAIQLLSVMPEYSDVKFAFTGELSDRRSDDYVSKLLTYVETPSIKQRIKILGLLDRQTQIIVMKNAKAIIQPSLFEGWGTVLEDAKVLDQQVILSDIPVHQEQMNENCVLFKPNDERDLMEKIIRVLHDNRTSDIEKGISNMKLRAKENALVFEQILFK